MSRVFIVQRTQRKNSNGTLEDRFDTSRADRFGQVQDLLLASASPFHPDPVLRELHAKLRDFGPEDYILCMGNPVLIGWAVTIASFYAHGKVCCLQWSGTNDRYIPVEADIMKHAHFSDTDTFQERDEAN